MTTSFILREWLETDLDSLVQQANNAAVARTMMNVFPHPYSPEDGKAFLSMAIAANPANRYAIVVQNQAIGGIGLHQQTDIYCKNMEIGYWLGQDFWGQGIATSAIKQMVAYGFRTFDCTRIFGRCFGNNPASMKALLNAGFVQEARLEKTFYKLNSFHDEVIFAVRKPAAY